jgi:ribose transport system substrate-binding protein
MTNGKSYLMLGTAILLSSLAMAASGQAAERTVALVLGVKGSPFYQALSCGAQAKAVTATGPAIAAIVPTDMQALIAPMKELSERGTKVITVDQTIGDSSFVQTQILTDNEAGGKLAADAMNELLGGKGKVLVITQPPGSAAQDARTAGFEEELKENFTGLEYLGPQYQSDDPQKAAEIVTSTLSAHPDLAGIFATNDQGAIGAITGLRQAGAASNVKVVAYDAATAEVNAFKNGTIHALIAQNPKQEGEIAMEAAAKLIKGGTLEKTTLTELVMIKAGDTAAAEKYEYKGDCE